MLASCEDMKNILAKIEDQCSSQYAANGETHEEEKDMKVLWYGLWCVVEFCGIVFGSVLLREKGSF